MEKRIFIPTPYACLVGATLAAFLFTFGCGGASAEEYKSDQAQQTHSLSMPEASGTVCVSDAGVTMDASNTADGYVMVKSEPMEKQLKTRLTKLEDAYSYDQPADNQYETFPLQMGDGDYFVQVYEQVEGNKYSRMFQSDLNVALKTLETPFLFPNQYVNYTADDQAVALSFELAQDITSPAKIVRKIYRYIVSNIAYDQEKAKTVPSGYLPSPDDTLQTGTGICFDYAALLATMLRVQGIPTKLVIGHVAPDHLYHAWNEAYVDGKWLFLDATLDGEGRAEADYQAERIY